MATSDAAVLRIRADVWRSAAPHADMHEPTRADTPPVDWSELGGSELVPTGMVTSLLADVGARCSCGRPKWREGARLRTRWKARVVASIAQVALACGDLVAARRCADETPRRRRACAWHRR
jgi:hypothetical protein